MIVFLVLFLCLFHILLLTQISYTVWPEMMLYPWLMDNGFNLYKDIVNPYLPGLSWFLWLYFKLFGFSIVKLKFLTWGIIFLLDWLIFLLAENLFNKRIALLALVFFIIGQPVLEGNGLWLDLILAPLLLLAFYFGTKKQWLMTVMILGVGFLIKQTMVVFLLLLFLRIPGKNKAYVWLFFLPLLVVTIYFISQNLLSDFYFWTIKYPLLTASKMPGYVILPPIRMAIILGALLFFTFTCQRLKNISLADKNLFLWMLFSLIFVYPRWSFFHLQPFLAFFSIFYAYIMYSIFHEKRLYYSKITITVLIIVFFIWSIVKIKSQIGLDDRFLDKQTKDVAVWINNNVRPNEKVFIFNGFQLAYFLSNRLPLKPWVDNFPWYMEIDGIQSRVVNSLKENKPEYLILNRFLKDGKYALGAYQPAEIVSYLENQYVYIDKITDSVEILKQK